MIKFYLNNCGLILIVLIMFSMGFDWPIGGYILLFAFILFFVFTPYAEKKQNEPKYIYTGKINRKK